MCLYGVCFLILAEPRHNIVWLMAGPTGDSRIKTMDVGILVLHKGI